MRELLTAIRTYCVSPSGNDANDGLTQLTPFATIQKAFDTCRTLDLGNYGVLIRLANGAYAGATALGEWVGGNPKNGPDGFGAPVTILGDAIVPSNVLINASGNCLVASEGAKLNIGGVKFATSSGGALYASAGGQIWVSQAVDFGACAGDHMLANPFGLIGVAHNYYISGGAQSHYRACAGGQMEAYNLTVFHLGAQTFTQAFAWASTGGFINANGNSYRNPSITGKAFDVSCNGVIQGVTTMPGSGSNVSTGGQYA